MRIISLVIALLMCCNLLQAQDQKAARAAEGRKAFKHLTPAQHLERLHAGVTKRMAMSADQQAQVDIVMNDFLATVEKQKANPSSLSKNIMSKTMADRNKRLAKILGAEGLKKFLAYEHQLKPFQPNPTAIIPQQQGALK